MTKWRCVNDLMGYCTKEPEWEKTYGHDTAGNPIGGTCKNDPKSCMKFRLLSEMIDISALPEPHLVETQHRLSLPKSKNLKLRERDNLKLK